MPVAERLVATVIETEIMTYPHTHTRTQSVVPPFHIHTHNTQAYLASEGGEASSTCRGRAPNSVPVEPQEAAPGRQQHDCQELARPRRLPLDHEIRRTQGINSARVAWHSLFGP
jgi:hypothetical protein